MIVLASNSPRRRQLMALGGWQFVVCPADVDESPCMDEQPREYVLRVAEEKAQAAWRDLPRHCLSAASQDALVLAADTAVVDGEQILGKPADAGDAWRMLCQLRGRSHQVFTSLVVLQPGSGRMLKDVCITDVPMREYTDSEIGAYIASGDPFDKAGAYAIQHEAFHPVEQLQGCYTNVMGLPLCHVTRMLAQFGVLSGQDVPRGCQDLNAYTCTVYSQLLPGKNQDIENTRQNEQKS